MRAPLAIDLFCGLGGWTEGLLAEGYEVVGYDIEAHEYDGERYPAKLVLEDVLTIHGSRFADADLIVASPPCQFFSYTAMPWTRAKALAKEVRDDPVKLAERLALFQSCFRIQREAIEAAERHIPLVVENVRGAIPWVGRSRGRFGSFHLWGDVPALMPAPVGQSGVKVPGLVWLPPSNPGHKKGQGFNTIADQNRRTDIGKGARFTSRDCGVEREGVKIGGDWFSDPTSICRRHGSKSKARKAASARIAKIPLTLSRWIAAHYRPAPEKLAS